MKKGLKPGSREALAEGCGLKLEDGKLAVGTPLTFELKKGARSKK